MNSFLSKYKILPPLSGFILGIILSEYFGNEWILITFLSPIFGALYLFKPRFGLLIFIPLGLLFSARPNLQGNNVLNFAGKELDIEGVLYKSPESREKGSRLFIDVDRIVIGGKEKPSSGKVIITTEETITGLAYGDRIRVIEAKLRPIRSFQNPGSFDIKRYYERQGLYARGFVPGKEWVISFGKSKGSNSFVHAVDKLRVKFAYFVRKKSPFPESEVLNAITIGDQGGIPPELRNEFSEAGIAHLLSISGLHVAAVAFVFYLIIKWILKRSEYLLLRFQVPRLTAALTILPVFIYMFVAGFATPVVRASIMAVVYLVSIVIGREENKLNTLAVSAFIILLWHPWALFELSFQLSFASVLGILLMHKFYPFKLNTFKDKLFTSVKTTVAASFATLPFIINTFGTVSIVTIPANLVAVPFVEFLIVPLGLITFLTFLVSEVVARVFLYGDVFLIKLLILGTKELVKFPLSSLTVPSPSYISWLVLLPSIIPLLFRKKYHKLRLLLPVFISGFLITWAFTSLRNPNLGFLEVNFLDAGSRNITFIRLPKEKTILIDGGFSKVDMGGFIEQSVVTPYLLKSGVTNINYLILTSLDKDHLEGVKNILQKFKVESIWTNGRKLDGELWGIIRDKGIVWKNILDEEIETLDIEGVEIELLKPEGEFNIKDSSLPYPILVRLTFKEVGLIIGEGITDANVITRLFEFNRGKIQNSVIYFPEVFMKQKGSLDFIRMLSPKIIVTNSALENILKLDNERKLNKYYNSSVFQTDTLGLVTVLTDGKHLQVKTFLDKKVNLIN